MLPFWLVILLRCMLRQGLSRLRERSRTATALAGCSNHFVDCAWAARARSALLPFRWSGCSAAPALTGRYAAPLLPSAQEDLKKKQRAERFGISVPISKEEFEVRMSSFRTHNVQCVGTALACSDAFRT